MWSALFLLAMSTQPQPGSVAWTLDMHERFAYAAMMRTAFIHDQSDRSKRHANQLQSLLANDEDPYSRAVREQAAKVAGAPTVHEQGAAIAATAHACGRCHAAHRVQPLFLGQDPAPPGKDLSSRMGRHIWAADRMWEALIAHSVGSWQRGAQALVAQPFFAGGDALGQRVDQIREIGVDAENADTWDKRVEVYGRFLSACAGCHEDYSR